MMVILVAILSLLLTPALASAASATLTWKDNSDNEVGFAAERKDATCETAGQFVELGRVGVDAVSYIDLTFEVGKYYCYRVRAFNFTMASGMGVEQFSPYSAEVNFSLPFPAPAAPAPLQVTGER